MNGKKSKALRRIARELRLNPKTEYAPVGPLRRAEARKDHGRVYSAGLVRRPFALKACERRAYQEAKALYKGQAADAHGGKLIAQADPIRPFADRVVDSIKRQPEGLT